MDDKLHRFRIQNADGEEVKLGPLGDVIEAIVSDARERGALDHLPGHGKPMQLKDDPFAGPDAEMHKILKQNNFVPEWLERNQAIRAELNWLRANPDHPEAAERATLVNQAIRKHNLIAPPQFHIPALYRRPR